MADWLGLSENAELTRNSILPQFLEMLRPIRLPLHIYSELHICVPILRDESVNIRYGSCTCDVPNSKPMQGQRENTDAAEPFALSVIFKDLGSHDSSTFIFFNVRVQRSSSQSIKYLYIDGNNTEDLHWTQIYHHNLF